MFLALDFSISTATLFNVTQSSVFHYLLVSFTLLYPHPMLLKLNLPTRGSTEMLFKPHYKTAYQLKSLVEHPCPLYETNMFLGVLNTKPNHL